MAALPHEAPNPAARLLADDAGKSLLRVLTCGSVDDGKSTLIGRLLADTGCVPEDQMAALVRDSARHGTRGDEPDYALLVDGLSAEREQGITIDVAYRFFATARRKFILIDAPGHEQYTRNMVTGASGADLAILLVDARKGLLAQTRRHACLARLLRVPNLVLAVNKMDLVGHAEAAFRRIEADFEAFSRRLGLPPAQAIPIVAVNGGNLAQPDPSMPWYHGPTLLDHLETVEPPGADEGPLRLPVQWVNRPDESFRGFAGTVASGRVAPGDRVRILPGGAETRVERVLTADGDRAQAVTGDAVTLTLADPVDCARGSVISAADAPVEVADQFEATLVWMDGAPLLPGRAYLLKSGAAMAPARISAPKHAIDVNSLEARAQRTLGLNDIGTVTVTTQAAIPFMPFDENRTLGGFILIDRETNATVGAGMIRFALRRSRNIHWQAIDITPEAHASLMGQQPLVLWFTGLSGSGKSTIANLVEKRLFALGYRTFLLDGDNVRHGLAKDLGFTPADRVENIRRVGEVAKLMTEAGLIVLTAFISPFRAERAMVRDRFPEGRFLEVFVDTPLEEAERRDVKGLYAKARAGELANFTGIDSPYEPPVAPDIHVETMREAPEAAAERIVASILDRIAAP
ncbi:MAG: adenylyl-sulfate kinase [Sphingomonadaceae bacterium]